MCKILVISPYVGLKDLFLEVNKQLKKDMDVYVGDLYDGLAIAKSLEHRGYDVIISRGATAKLLQKHLITPVMEIPLTGYDILRTLTLLNGFSGKIGMMSYLNNIPGAHTIGKLLNMDITFYPINEEHEIEGEIERASNEGVQIIIGDVITTTAAAKFGIQAILITSGKEAIIETIANVEQLMYYVDKERNYANQLQEAFANTEEGVFIFDDSRVCTFMNEQAKRYVQFLDEGEVLTWNKLQTMIPNLNGLGEELKEIEVTMNGHTIQFRFTLLTEKNCFALFIKRKNPQQIEKSQEQPAYFHFNSLVARSEKIKQLLEVAKKVSRSNLPVIIYGEQGVGKESLAQAIHNHSERRQHSYVYINCEAYTASQLERELFGERHGEVLQRGALERANNGTLFIEAIGSMPFDLQGKLFQALTTKQITFLPHAESVEVNVRFVVADTKPLDLLVQRGKFREDLYEALNCFMLKIPPLRERIEDMDDLVRLFIASSNAVTKKQISGLRTPVLKEMKKLAWPGNIEQLKWTIEQMCLLSGGPFIEHQDVESLLSKLKVQERDSQLNAIDIHGKTLQNIEEEVIMTVLKQEDFNQSQAAKRLGINRSTLWRKIKQLT